MKKTEVYAYYFPNWHVDKQNEKWHGEGWTEWEVSKCARPRFEGHEQPRIPLWGYEDESDPKVMEKKIDTALKYGIDGFIFDTYWYEDGPYRERALNEGFLKAKNCEKLKFSLMWCNHDAIYAHPAPGLIPPPVLKKGSVSEKAFVEMTDYFIANYFNKPNYMKIEGKIFFIIYNLEHFIRDMGGEQQAARVIKQFRERVKNAGLGDMQIGFLPGIMEDLYFSHNRKELNRIIKAVGVDEGVRYWWDMPKKGMLTYDYAKYAEGGIASYRTDKDFLDVPANITVVNGLDQSPRTIQSETYRATGEYPWYAIITNVTVKAFENALREAKRFAESADYTGHFITISTWNEWTEGNYLEPDTKNGYAFLETIKKVMDE